MKKRPTLYDVARVAGVSHMTVSRVVRGNRGVSPNAQLKVRSAIDETGYKPDPALSALAAYRTQKMNQGKGDGSTLFFLDCDGSVYSGNVLLGVRAEGSLYGYSVESCRLPSDTMAQKRLCRVLFYRGVRGLLLGPSNDEWDLKIWSWCKFAAVSLGALSHNPAMHSVAMDYFDGAYSACSLLRKIGCKRIGFVVSPELEYRTGHRWLGGYFAAMGQCDKIIYRGRYPLGHDFKRWVQKEKIDGILTIHSDVKRMWDKESNRIVLLNNTCGLNDVTHLAIDPERIGIEGVRFLHHLLLRQEYGIPLEPKMVSLRGTWIQHVSDK